MFHMTETSMRARTQVQHIRLLPLNQFIVLQVTVVIATIITHHIHIRYILLIQALVTTGEAADGFMQVKYLSQRVQQLHVDIELVKFVDHK